MFSGIVRAIGKVTKNDNGNLSIGNVEIADSVTAGSSVCVSGVCLTVARKNGGTMEFNIMQETFSKTSLDALREGDVVNLEPSLRVGDEIGGHFVYGHIDGVGEITKIKKDGESVIMEIKMPNALMTYMSPKGSVAIDGVSLTIVETEESRITVSLVQHTLSHTTLGKIKIGDKVNIECDMIAKYLKNLSKNLCQNQ